MISLDHPTTTRNAGAAVTRSFKDWIAEGESLYQNALAEFRELEGQIEEIERKLAVKREEVNEIARVVGKEPIAELKKPIQGVEVIDRGQPHAIPTSAGTIARAITGRINR
jgi:hypothetical protein